MSKLGSYGLLKGKLQSDLLNSNILIIRVDCHFYYKYYTGWSRKNCKCYNIFALKPETEKKLFSLPVVFLVYLVTSR